MKNPLNGAKLVSKLTFLHLYHYVNETRDKYPVMVIKGLFWACTLALALIISAIGLHLISTAYGRIAEDIIMQVGMALVFCVFCFLVGFITWTFLLRAPKAIANPVSIKRAEISAGPEWVAPEIGTDNLLCLLPGEQMEQYSNRCKAAESKRAYATWSALIQPFKSECVIFTGDTNTDFFFSRGSEPFAELYPEDSEAIKKADHFNESLNQYQKYVDWFAPRFVRWVGAAKLEANQGRAQKTLLETIENSARTIVLTILLLFAFAPAISAQSKTRQVDETLGTRIREIPQPGDNIDFVFQEGSKEKHYNRTGNGKSDYTSLLQNPPGIGGYNDEGGQLLWIEKNGEVICRAEQVQEVAQPENRATRIRPIGEPASVPGEQQGRGFAFEFPDSARTSLNLEQIKNDIRTQRSKAWRSIAPMWDFCMWVFGGLLIFLICAWGIFNYIAASAANESLVTIYGRVIAGRWIIAAQQNAAAFCLMICWVIAAVFLINEFLWLVWLNLPLWALLAIWFPSLWIITKLTDWAVPNLKVTGSKETGLTPY